MKECGNCKKIKELSEFGLRPDSPDGHRNACKTCQNAYFSWRKENKELIAANKERIANIRKNPTPGMKYCISCDQEKLISGFGKGSDPDGLRNCCKELL